MIACLVVKVGDGNLKEHNSSKSDVKSMVLIEEYYHRPPYPQPEATRKPPRGSVSRTP